MCIRDRYMIQPEFKRPKTPQFAGAGLELTARSYAHLFWAVDRDDAEEKWTCEVDTVNVSLAQAVQVPWNGSATRSFSVTMPFLQNARPIANSEPVVLTWPKPMGVDTPPTTRTWVEVTKADMLAKAKRQTCGCMNAQQPSKIITGACSRIIRVV